VLQGKYIQHACAPIADDGWAALSIKQQVKTTEDNEYKVLANSFQCRETLIKTSIGRKVWIRIKRGSFLEL
jgi:hypothetical protein